MKILQIIDSLRMGGAQKLLTVFTEEAQRRGHEIEVVTLMDYKKDSAIFDDLEKQGVLVKCLPLKNLGDISSIKNLIRFIKGSKPDIIHTQLNYANIVGTWSALKAVIPSVASLHNASIHLFKERRYRTWLETWMLNSYSRRVIACGYTVAKVQQPRFKTKILDVIPNPVPPLKKVTSIEAQDFRAKFLPGSKGILLVAIGRLIPEKGYPDMLKAMQIIQEHAPTEFKLVIAGSGPLLGQLQDTAKKLSLEKHIHFIGQRNDIAAILAAADIYISSSLFEGQSIAVLEAMAAGLPVIVTEVGDNKNVISPELRHFGVCRAARANGRKNSMADG